MLPVCDGINTVSCHDIPSFLQTMQAQLCSLRLGRLPVEPPPRSRTFSAVAYGRHYLWRGYGSGEGSNIIAVYDPSNELWNLLPTTGRLPPGECGGRSVCVGRCLYTFGGREGWSSFFNNMNKLNLDTLQWAKLQTSGSQPMKKGGCDLVRVNERTLCCFGGVGIEGTTQPGSTFTKIGNSGGHGMTNEFHFFDIQHGNFCQCAHSLYVFIIHTHTMLNVRTAAISLSQCKCSFAALFSLLQLPCRANC